MNTAGDLTPLVTLLAQRKLVAPVELEADWRNVGDAIDALLSRSISGKAVLHLDQTVPSSSGGFANAELAR